MTSTKEKQDLPTQNFQIQRLYVKEQIFKIPNAPHVFVDEWKPEISMEMQVKSNVLQDNHHEVILIFNITAKNSNRTAFTCELQQAGIFKLEGFTDEQKTQLLNAYCPNILFPYARKQISEITVESSFPPLTLSPVNFDALYLEQQKQQQAGTQKQNVKEESTTLN